MWSSLGCVLALALAALAWWRSRGVGGFYEREIYGMTARMHRRYAIVAIALAVLFGAIRFTGSTAILIPCFAAFALLAVFYGASFLRGFSDDDG